MEFVRETPGDAFDCGAGFSMTSRSSQSAGSKPAACPADSGCGSDPQGEAAEGSGALPLRKRAPLTPEGTLGEVLFSRVSAAGGKELILESIQNKTMVLF